MTYEALTLTIRDNTAEDKIIHLWTPKLRIFNYCVLLNNLWNNENKNQVHENHNVLFVIIQFTSRYQMKPLMKYKSFNLN